MAPLEVDAAEVDAPVDAPDALVELAASPSLREQLAAGGLTSVQERTWERALQRLGDGYRMLLTANDSSRVARAAA